MTSDDLSAQQTLLARAKALHGQVPLIDGHNDYPWALRENAALGSGVVEAACKTLVTQRPKISGASWSRPGSAGVLYVRTLVQSDRFDDALRFRHRSPHAA